jgi:hypothetical protein
MHLDSIMLGKMGTQEEESVELDTTTTTDQEWALDYDADGNAYYYNLHNHEETSWELPVHVRLVSQQPHLDATKNEQFNPPQLTKNYNENLLDSTTEEVVLSEQLAAQIAELEAELAAVLPVTQTRHEEREMAAFEAHQKEIENSRVKKIAVIEAEIAAAEAAQTIEAEAERIRKEQTDERRVEHQARMEAMWNEQHVISTTESSSLSSHADVSSHAGAAIARPNYFPADEAAEEKHLRTQQEHRFQMDQEWNKQHAHHNTTFDVTEYTEQTEKDTKHQQQHCQRHAKHMEDGWHHEFTKIRTEEERKIFAAEEKEVAEALLAATPTRMYELQNEAKKQGLLKDHEEKMQHMWEMQFNAHAKQDVRQNVRETAEQQKLSKQKEHEEKMKKIWDEQFVQAHYTQEQRIELEEVRKRRQKEHETRMSAALSVQITHFRTLEVVGEEFTQPELLGSVLETLEKAPMDTLPSIAAAVNREQSTIEADTTFHLVESVLGDSEFCVDHSETGNNAMVSSSSSSTTTTNNSSGSTEGGVEDAMLQEQRFWLRERRWGCQNSSVSEACVQVLQSYNAVAMRYMQRAAQVLTSQYKNQGSHQQSAWTSSTKEDRPKIQYCGSSRVAQLAQPFYKGFRKDEELPGKLPRRLRKNVNGEHVLSKDARVALASRQRLDFLNCSNTLLRRCDAIIVHFQKKIAETPNPFTQPIKDFEALKTLTLVNQARILVTGNEPGCVNGLQQLVSCIDDIEQQLKHSSSQQFGGLAALLPIVHLDVCAYLSRVGDHVGAMSHAKKSISTLQDFMLMTATPTTATNGTLLKDRSSNMLFLNHYSFGELSLLDPTVLLGISYHNLAVELEYLNQRDVAYEWHSRACELVQIILSNRFHPVRVALEAAHDACRSIIEQRVAKNVAKNIEQLPQTQVDSIDTSDELILGVDWESRFSLDESLDWIGNVESTGSKKMLNKSKLKRNVRASAPTLGVASTNQRRRGGGGGERHGSTKQTPQHSKSTAALSLKNKKTSVPMKSQPTRGVFSRKRRKGKKNVKKPRSSLSASSSLIAERKKKHAAGKLQATARGFQSRHSNPVSVRMNKEFSEISLRGVNPAWIRNSSSEWWSGLVRVKVDYALERSTYFDALWLVTVFVGHKNGRIMFLAHNTTATGNQEMETRLVIYGKRAAALISYSCMRAKRNCSDDSMLNHAIQSNAGAFLAECLRLVETRSRGNDERRQQQRPQPQSDSNSGSSAARSRRQNMLTPPVHLVVKTDIHIGLIQSRYKAKLEQNRLIIMKYNLERNATEQIESGAATTVQSLFRGRTQRRTRDMESKAATAVQALLRGKVTRSQIHNELNFHRKKRSAAATKLQARVRRRSVMRERSEQGSAATKLQSRLRGRIARKGLVSVKNGMMSKNAHARDISSGEYGRLKQAGLREHEIHAAIRLSNLVN